VSAFSTVWTNYTGFTETNIMMDPNDPTMMITNIVTNTVEIGFHIWIVDNQMRTRFPVKVHEFTTFSTNVTIGDRVNVYETMAVDAEQLTVTGALNVR